MSDESHEGEIEQLVERQARGEATGAPVDPDVSGSGQLDTRQSKSGFAAGSLFGQTFVEIPGAEVDSPGFIAQQTGVGMPSVTEHHVGLDVHSATRGMDINQYPDLVDQPDYIQAHMQPSIGDAPVSVASEPLTSAPEVADAPVSSGLEANQYPDAVDRPEFIAGHAGGGAAPQDPLAREPDAVVPEDTGLGVLRTPETEVHVGPSQPA